MPERLLFTCLLRSHYLQDAKRKFVLIAKKKQQEHAAKWVLALCFWQSSCHSSCDRACYVVAGITHSSIGIAFP